MTKEKTDIYVSQVPFRSWIIDWLYDFFIFLFYLFFFWQVKFPINPEYLRHIAIQPFWLHSNINLYIAGPHKLNKHKVKYFKLAQIAETKYQC